MMSSSFFLDNCITKTSLYSNIIVQSSFVELKLEITSA